MARITVEDCLKKENNRFALILLAAKRTKQLLNGGKLSIEETKNKSVVTALREIAAGNVRFKTDEDIERERELEEARQEAALDDSSASTEGATPVETSDPNSNSEEEAVAQQMNGSGS